ncbi:helicase-related protein [Sphingomonas sp. BGYR3]|uniref:helicase-related protein n=1 Tax=Sphingomonas sp. BGYR3 TaxID=2975483 RepID=UPI0021A40344|nr:helicase-related protein [Sphingomonas sp. BGYR3]MDG5487993.1 helicase-related protein [Sphingomonas sp. BGYR3]
MAQFAHRPVTAVLGPTNTGKTHLAIERMCGHSSGMIGFPLRLLAREVYDRVVRIKGANQVGLITGEEKILPPDARWLLCTAESMPTDRSVGFVALDEAQLGADPERGHVFTDRLLNVRGRDETMILGSESLRPMVRSLIPDAEIITRPRFSTLSYAGAKKLSRLPRRSAIVAFSAEEVYAVAEALRRLRGGAAVVMGALSPSTRNAQVAMFQAGEVDYLVATDAIGMGLNMDVGHVAFASLHKFDGRRHRRLTVAEMAQIAGRAGRHQRDGTFGALHEDGPEAFQPEEVLAIEGHRVPPLEQLYWRNGAPDFSGIDALIDSLERRPADPVLRAAPEAVDLAVLKRLAAEGWVRDRARHPAMIRRLWAACGLPDFRKLGPDPHARFVGRLFRHLSEGTGHIPQDWFAQEIDRLDRLGGDVETIAGRIAAARSWAYIAHRSDWLENPAHWAERTRAIEERLSDALHACLTQRFVDRRTSVLLRQIGADPAALPVDVDADGAVSVEGEPLGRLSGFRFEVAADARASDKRMLLAAAEKRLAGELAARADALAASPDAAFSLTDDGTGQPRIAWNDVPVAALAAGPAAHRPRVRLDRATAALPARARDLVQGRLDRWLADQLNRHLPGLAPLAALASAMDAPPGVRVVAAALLDGLGIAPRDGLAAAVDTLPGPARHALRRAGVTIGTLDLFDPRMLKPHAARLRHALFQASGSPVPAPAPAGATVIAASGNAAPGFRRIGDQAVRIDLVERLARGIHDARVAAPADQPFEPPMALATSIGLTAPSQDRLMTALGFRRRGQEPGWVWHGRRRPPRQRTEPVARPGNAFSGLAELMLNG